MTSKLISRGFQNIKRSGWRAFAIIFIMFFTFLILGLQLVVMYFSQELAKYFVEKPEVIGFFKDGVTEEQIQAVKNEIGNIDYVVEVRYISKEEALKSFIEENKDDREIIESITVNPFPAHLNVKVNSLDRVSNMADFFRSNELIDKVIASEKILETLRRIVLGIQILGFGLLSIFSFTTFVILFLAVGLTVYAQKDEIRVMKLVGASNWYIRLPFLFQSAVYGFVASIISTSIVAGLLFWKYNEIASNLLGKDSIPHISIEVVALGTVIQITFALVLSLFSSYIATKRYISN